MELQAYGDGHRGEYSYSEDEGPVKQSRILHKAWPMLMAGKMKFSDIPEDMGLMYTIAENIASGTPGLANTPVGH